LDPSANADIASAFETHPCVKSAARVRKFSDMVIVDLIYRQPVAMIWVPYQDKENSRWKKGVYALDALGYVVPVSEDYAQKLITDFLIIDIENIGTQATGAAYADARVHQALKLAAYLESSGRQKDLGLQWLTVRRDDDVSSGRPWLLQLQTSDKKRQIIWGHAPGEEISGEDSAERKLTQMVSWLRSEIDSGTQGGLLDLTNSKLGTGQTASAR
jgi:hypothetical protein